MRKALNSILKAAASPAVMAMLMAEVVAPAAQAKDWQAVVGAQSRDLGNQALAFLPNELWIHAGDSIRWTFTTNEIHTVTFLKSNQARPPLYGAVFGAFVGCPGTSPDGSSFDNSTCVTAGISVSGQTYSVKFSTAGNFKLVCLVHADMTGVVHVLSPSATLPHDQNFYDRQADNERVVLIADGSRLTGQGNSAEEGNVTAGIGEIAATGGGSQTATLIRFLQAEIVVRVGDTVEWTNRDPSIAHTVTFGIEPADPRPPSLNVSPTSDGAYQAVINSLSDSVHSGRLLPTPQDRTGLPQSPPGVARFRVTFMAPGTFNYICSLHDDLGMKGTVIVHP
jgi:plastocyanin